MSGYTRKTGRCACGEVTFTVIAPDTYGACHCEMCRRWCGGVWMGVVCEDVLDVNGPVVDWKSSKIASRAFCKTCGSSIWHKPGHTEKFTFGQGLFDDQRGWRMTREIFSEQRPAHYAFSDRGQVPLTGWATFWAALFGRLPK